MFGFLTIGSNSAILLSAPLVIRQATAISTEQIGLLTGVAGLMAVAGMIIAGAVSDRRGERFSTMLTSTSMASLAMGAMALSLAASPGFFAAAYLVYYLAFAAVLLSNAMLWPDLLDRRTLAVGSAAINSMSQVGSFLMPLAWGVLRDGTGDFRWGMILITVSLGAAVLVACSARAQSGRPSQAPT